MSFFIDDDSKETNVLELLFWLLSLQDTFVDKPISHNFPLNFVGCHECPDKGKQVETFNVSSQMSITFVGIMIVVVL